jgi:hypothetical protein
MIKHLRHYRKSVQEGANAEEWDAIRDRTVDGHDTRTALMRAAEGAGFGPVQNAVDQLVQRVRRRRRSSYLKK